MERKARGEKDVTHADGVSALPIIGTCTQPLKQRWFSMVSPKESVFIKHFQLQLACFLINRQVDNLSSENFISGVKTNLNQHPM